LPKKVDKPTNSKQNKMTRCLQTTPMSAISRQSNGIEIWSFNVEFTAGSQEPEAILQHSRGIMNVFNDMVQSYQIKRAALVREAFGVGSDINAAVNAGHP
jgi:hypothetical protein